MTDFSTYAPPLTWTTVLAASNLSNVTPASTSAIPIGSGQPPYENRAMGVDFVFTTVHNDAIGNLTINFECSYDGAVWFAIPAMQFVGTVVATVPTRLTLPVGSRQWRFVRASSLAENAQSGTPSTIAVKAILTGLHVPYTKS